MPDGRKARQFFSAAINPLPGVMTRQPTEKYCVREHARVVRPGQGRALAGCTPGAAAVATKQLLQITVSPLSKPARGVKVLARVN